jgi:hypothetical protein
MRWNLAFAFSGKLTNSISFMLIETEVPIIHFPATKESL